jgi:hypothetical protein
MADPFPARSKVRELNARTLDRGFESRFGRGCFPWPLCVVLSCVGRALAMG